MKKKITLLLIAVALCVGGFPVYVNSVRAADSAEIKTAVKDTKAEISYLKSEIKTLESNLSSAKKSLEKARRSEDTQRALCDDLSTQIANKKGIYKLAESRIAAGNTRAAEGQAALAAEIQELEDQYTASLEQWEMDKLVANDSNTVIEINKKLIALRKSRLRELDARVEALKSSDAEAALAQYRAEVAKAEEAEKAAKAAAVEAAKVQAEAAEKLAQEKTSAEAQAAEAKAAEEKLQAEAKETAEKLAKEKAEAEAAA